MDGAVAGAAGLIGRELELAAVHRVVGSLVAGEGGLLVVDGATGTGKSSLLAELRVRAEERGVHVRHGVAIELDRDQPFAVIERALGERVPRSGGRGSVAALAEGGLASVQAMIEAVAGGPRPLLVCFDDIHWADEQSLRVIGLLAASARSRALMVALAWRRAELAHDHARRLSAVDGVVHLRVGDLGAAESAELVRRGLPGADRVFASASHRLTGGNPLLLSELVAEFAASGQRPDGAAAERLGELTPGSMRATVLTRLGQLTDEAVRLASAVAVLGDGTPVHHAAHVARLDPDQAAAATDRLVALELLVGEETVSFRHPMLGAAVLEDLGSFTRSRLYRRAADVVAADGLLQRAAALLLRSSPAGDPAAVEILHKAAAGALESGDAAAAARLLKRALDEPARAKDRPRVLVDLARAETALGDPASLEHLDQALSAIASPSERARALRGLARLHHMRYEFPRAVRLAARARAEVGDGDPEHERMLATWLLAASLDPERQDEALGLHRQLAAAAARGEPPRDPELQASLGMYLLATRGDASLAAQLAELAVPGDAIVNDDGLGLAGDFALHVLLATGRLAALVSCAGMAQETAERHASMLGAASAACWRAHARLAQGDPQGAIADAHVGLAPRRYGWPAHSTYAAGALALARLELADLTGAADAIAIIPEVRIPDPPRSYFAGLVELAGGHAGAARQLFDRAGRELVDVWGFDTPAIVPWRSGAALAALAEQDTDAADALSAAELELARETGIPVVIGRALRVRGLSTPGGDGISVLREACEALAETESTLDQLRCQVDLGSALRRDGARRDARELLALARARAEQLGCKALATRAAEEQHASGARPRRVPLKGAAALTPSERRIAELAAGGATNRQIAAELYLTPKTVEWHLSHVFSKLDISSRRQLAAALSDERPSDAGTREPANQAQRATALPS